jgi:hypothetical protein
MPNVSSYKEQNRLADEQDLQYKYFDKNQFNVYTTKYKKLSLFNYPENNYINVSRRSGIRYLIQFCLQRLSE